MNTPTARPIPRRGEAISFSAAAQSESATALIYLLNNTRPDDLYDRIQRAVAGHMMLPADIDNLLASLQTVGVVTSAALAVAHETTVRHCVRCHAKYLERHNGLNACSVMHDKPRLMKSDKPAKDGSYAYKHFYPCCNHMADACAPPKFPHFTGRHTTVEGNVVYTATNIVKCGQRGCPDSPTPAPSNTDVPKA